MEIPKEAKLKFKGILFDTYQWEQKQFDGSLKTFEMVKRRPTVDIICVHKDKIMILNEEQPGRPAFPCLPGGRIEEGEDPIQAAKRELAEETGYKAKNMKVIAEWTGQSKIEFHEFLMLAQDCAKEAPPHLDSGERITAAFVSYDKFLALARNSEFRAPINLKYMMYEALLDDKKRRVLQKEIWGVNQND